ncbi:hypothetical protein ANCCEY_00157 [Ancylostoma ceylanicum]|uniref:Animal hem peroxidase n=1 Tax=Ancylostoma ceylanicum TaxID=53326 RepID=A0A0D6MBY1_9BILA|nr:hypothetical protein ANCCEY_00157 [Ancylostoma ceylanicum]
MRVLILALLAIGCRSDSLEDTVVEAIKTAHENLVKREKDIATVEGNIIQTQKANADSQLEQLKGDLLSEATKIVVGQLGSGVLDELANLDADELLARAGETQARKKRQAAGCGRGPMDCGSQESNIVRSITGKCNNKRNSTWGAAVTPVRRLLGKPSYADGPNGKDLDCTSCDSPNVSENCAPIPVPADDSYFKSYNNGTSRCIRLTRALNAQKGLGVRTQINQNTHFLDLSAVYGSEECEGASVRSFANGELKTYIHNGDILPPQKKNDTNCLSKDPYYCFTTGDFRNSLHPGLVPLHSTYIKEHNRLAAQFKKCNPDWNDERIFQEARRVNIAQYQHHVYDEYLPNVIGDKLMTDFRLKPLRSGFVTDYSPSVNAALSAEFAAAAFRFGHGQARKDFPRSAF